MTTTYDGIAKEYQSIEAAEPLAMCEAITRNLTLATMELALKSAGIKASRPHPLRAAF